MEWGWGFGGVRKIVKSGHKGMVVAHEGYCAWNDVSMHIKKRHMIKLQLIQQQSYPQKPRPNAKDKNSDSTSARVDVVVEEVILQVSVCKKVQGR